MNEIRGDYFDAHSSRVRPGVLKTDGESLVIELEDGDRVSHPIQTVQVSKRIGSIPRSITFVSGARFTTLNNEGVDQLFRPHGKLPRPDGGLERWVDRLEKNKKIAAISAVATVATLAVLYFLVIPLTARQIVKLIPDSTNQALAKEAREFLENRYFEESRLDVERLEGVQKTFHRIEDAYPQIRFNFRLVDGDIGANALALPDGTIFVTDDLARLVDNDELFAVLLHEVGHVTHKHGLQMLVKQSIVSALLLIVVGDMGLINIPAMILDSAYSREAEYEADGFSARALRKAGLEPTLLVDALESLERSRKHGGSFPEFLSSHPHDDGRFKNIEKY